MVAAPVAAAHAPPLVGAASHPLWSSYSATDVAHELDLIKAAGGNTVRIDLGWATLEAAGKGMYDSSYVAKADSFFAAAHARGLKVVVTMWETPCWASSAPDDVKQDCTGSWWTEPRMVQHYPPANPADFAAAAAWVAQRWGADIAALEVWNEPNLWSFWRTSTPEADYAALLKASYGPIKAAAPNVQVIGPGLLRSDYVFLGKLYDLGIQPYEDGISTHPFSNGRSPYDPTAPYATGSYIRDVPMVRDTMVAHGDSAKKEWFTEMGYSSCVGSNDWCIGPDLQAEYIADTFRIIRDDWDYVAANLIYTLRNTGTSTSSREDQVGMLNMDYSEKPAYGAFRDVLADLRANPDPPPPPASQPQPTQPTTQPASVVAQPIAPAAPPQPRVARPRIGGLTITPAPVRRRMSIGFRLSAAARVTFTLQRRAHGRWPAVRSFAFARDAAAGTNRISRRARLRPGSYRLVARPAGGAARSARFRASR